MQYNSYHLMSKREYEDSQKQKQKEEKELAKDKLEELLFEEFCSNNGEINLYNIEFKNFLIQKIIKQSNYKYNDTQSIQVYLLKNYENLAGKAEKHYKKYLLYEKTFEDFQIDVNFIQNIQKTNQEQAEKIKEKNDLALKNEIKQKLGPIQKTISKKQDSIFWLLLANLFK